MDVSGKRHATAALPKGKDPDTQSTDGWVGPRVGMDVLERVKSLLHSGIWTWIHPASLSKLDNK
jgi:hypothetical protein